MPRSPADQLPKRCPDKLVPTQALRKSYAALTKGVTGTQCTQPSFGHAVECLLLFDNMALVLFGSAVGRIVFGVNGGAEQQGGLMAGRFEFL